jgi:CBS domain-containing protein
MPVPTYDKLMDPLLRFLASRPDGAVTSAAYAALSQKLCLTDSDKAERIPSGTQPVYQNRISWAHSYLKRAGLSSSPKHGTWRITDGGRTFLKKHVAPFGLDDLNAALNVASGEVPDPTPRIGAVPSATGGVVSITRDATVQQATTTMLLHNYSQLPVMQGERTVQGVVTWKSIGKSFALDGSAMTVKDVMDVNVTTVREQDPLFDVIPILLDREFVLVKDDTNLITGIITLSDLVLEYRSMTEPFVLLGAIENHIRRFAVGRFSVETLRSVADPADTARTISAVFDLTLGEYQRLFQNDENWKKLGLKVDRAAFDQALNRVRQIRNDVMHFDPEADDDNVAELRDFERFLREIS